MSFDQYDIFFSGQLIEGSDVTVARTKIAALFKLPPERVEHLFSGKPIAVKRSVDMDTAVKYRTAFRDAGALLEIKPVATTEPSKATSIPDVPPTSESKPATPIPDSAPPSPPQPAAEPAGSGLTLNPANTGSLEDCAPEVIPAEIGDISQISMAAVGTTIDESEPPPPLEIDTSALSIKSDELD
jgi:hypothetical protein